MISPKPTPPLKQLILELDKSALADFEGFGEWHTLAQDQKETLFKLLRDRIFPPGKNDGESVYVRRTPEIFDCPTSLMTATFRHDVDLERVNKSLLQPSAPKYQSRRDLPPPLSPPLLEPYTPPPSEYDFIKTPEILAYYNLIGDGGRPAYPLHRINHIAMDPEEYEDILRPWEPKIASSITRPQWEYVFQYQLSEWGQFKIWQKERRGHFDHDHEFATYRKRCRWASLMQGLRQTFNLPESTQFLNSCKNLWIYRRSMSHDVLWQLNPVRTFSEYVETVKRRLARHGFTHSFQLQEDSTQQDELSTWIEYLHLEYCSYDRYADGIKALEPLLDKAREDLFDMKTDPEFIDIEVSACEDNLKYSKSMVEYAKRCVKEVMKVILNNPTISTQAIGKMLEPVKSELDAGIDVSAQEQKRLDLLQGMAANFKRYEPMKKDLDIHSRRVSWILSQIPLLEAELNDPALPTGNTSETRGTKRDRSDDPEEEEDERPLKRRRIGAGEYRIWKQ